MTRVRLAIGNSSAVGNGCGSGKSLNWRQSLAYEQLHSSTASDGFSVLLHDVLAEGLDDCHHLLMLSWLHLVLVKGL